MSELTQADTETEFDWKAMAKNIGGKALNGAMGALTGPPPPRPVYAPCSCMKWPEFPKKHPYTEHMEKLPKPASPAVPKRPPPPA